jgi:hypothetical protein
MTPGDKVAQLYPQALGTHFSRLLRHGWVTMGLLFNPGHHTGFHTFFSSPNVIRVIKSRWMTRVESMDSLKKETNLEENIKKYI